MITVANDGRIALVVEDERILSCCNEVESVRHRLAISAASELSI